MLTRSGWGALVVAAAAIAAGRLFGIIELYVLGAGIVAAVLWALLSIARAMPRPTVRRRISPTAVMAGDAARVDLVLSNDTLRRTPILRLWEPVGDGGAVMHLAQLRPGEHAAVAYRMPTARRGLVVVGPLSVRRTDVLGLAARRAVLAGTAELLVTPRHDPAPFASTSAAGPLGDVLRLKALGQTGSEFHALRPYAAGDDPRRINWKATARSIDVIVTDTAPEGLRRCTVVLDVDIDSYASLGPDGDAEAFERAVSAAASIVTGAAAAGLLTRLLATDIDLRGPDIVSNALRWMAAAEPRRASIALPALQTAEGLGLIAIVTGRSDTRLVADVRSAAGPDEVIVTVVTSSLGSNDDRFVVDATDTEAFAAAWNATVGGGAGSDRRLPAAYRADR
jgi:uncharacterized protein (DUF58 family)